MPCAHLSPVHVVEIADGEAMPAPTKTAGRTASTAAQRAAGTLPHTQGGSPDTDLGACPGAHCSPPSTASGGACLTLPKPSLSSQVRHMAYGACTCAVGRPATPACLSLVRSAFQVTGCHGQQLGTAACHQWCVLDHTKVPQTLTAACRGMLIPQQGQALRAGSLTALDLMPC